MTSSELTKLISIRGTQDKAQPQVPDDYRLLAEKILQQGEPLLAFDVVREGLAIFPADVRLRQLQGLALARSGGSERATAILEELRDEGLADEETLGMLGRTYKDLATTALSEARRVQFLKRAAGIYEEAYKATSGYWSGINSATTRLILGERERATELALKVRTKCLESVRQEPEDQYWLFAALGEAALILRDWSEAWEWYRRAASQAGRRFGNIHSSRRNARLILQYWNEDPAEIDKYLQIPNVIVFAGHMIDRPDRTVPRFPRELESVVAKEIRGKIDILKPGFGFASAACGSDILFVESILDAGAEVTVVLPYSKEEFVFDSVDFLANSDWRQRFEHVLDRVTRVITASAQRLKIGGVSYEFCNEMLLGLASIRARQVDATLIPLAVWNGIDGDGPGGSATAVEYWRTHGYQPEIVNLAKLLDRQTPCQKNGSQSAAIPKMEPRSSVERFRSRIVAILFADAVGFSKLTEAEVPRFVQHFLGKIARVSDRFQDTILARNTWGDGLYFVFSDIDDAGKFAIRLAHLVATTKWEEKGLPRELNLRIGLHAGPVYEFDDPITGCRSYTGTHVSRAARIEPITPAGLVYATEAFAALAAAHRTNSFNCDYVGQTPMAKGYGTWPTYHVRPGSTWPA